VLNGEGLTRAKVKFLSESDAAGELGFIPPDVLPEIFGGKAPLLPVDEAVRKFGLLTAPLRSTAKACCFESCSVVELSGRCLPRLSMRGTPEMQGDRRRPLTSFHNAAPEKRFTLCTYHRHAMHALHKRAQQGRLNVEKLTYIGCVLTCGCCAPGSCGRRRGRRRRAAPAKKRRRCHPGLKRVRLRVCGFSTYADSTCALGA
jgi:hypothetical protein